MTIELYETLTVAGIAAAGINAGAFFAFSNFVMPALGKLPASDGAAAMQAINRAAPNPGFMATLFGAVLITAPLAADAIGRLDEADARYLVAGFVLSAATALITAAFHVPRNNALDRVDAAAPSGTATWRRYLVEWTRGNHVRSLTSAASAVALALSLGAG